MVYLLIFGFLFALAESFNFSASAEGANSYVESMRNMVNAQLNIARREIPPPPLIPDEDMMMMNFADWFLSYETSLPYYYRKHFTKFWTNYLKKYPMIASYLEVRDKDGVIFRIPGKLSSNYTLMYFHIDNEPKEFNDDGECLFITCKLL